VAPPRNPPIGGLLAILLVVVQADRSMAV